MRIGRFEIQGELGRGGMGVVFRAHDPHLERPVAIKKLTSLQPEHLERFRIEARAAGRLNHPNITVLYEAGDHDGEPFLVMELLGGENLKSLLERGEPSALERKLDIVRQVCLGLDYAHREGVLAHRDIKPGNIQVLPSGQVKLMDFGIAKLADTLSPAQSLTQANTVLGTLSYLSPEQIRGLPLDGRTDIWSVGVVLYELLCGRKPFNDDADDLTVMKRIVVEDPPDPPPLGVAADEDIRRVLAQAMAKHRSRRFPRALDMASALDRALKRLADPPPPPSHPKALDLLREGRQHFEAGDLGRAAACYHRVLLLDPSHSGARRSLEICESVRSQRRLDELVRLGILMFRNRENQLAISALEEALKLDPGHPDARTVLTWARRERDRTAEKAAGLDELVQRALSGLDEDPPEPAAPGPPARP